MPSNHPPRALYSAFVEQSDIFIGIYGTGYGWVDESSGMEISGLHDEWQLSARKPRFIFVKDTEEQRELRLEGLLSEIADAGVSFNRFKTRTELLSRARDAIALCVSERFLALDAPKDHRFPDYGADLARNIEKFPVLETEFYLNYVLPAFNSNQRTFIKGNAGSGKTAILYLLGQKSKSIYISLRRHSLLGVLVHISNHLSQITGEAPKEILSLEMAQIVCEGLLQQVKITLLIDDIEQAPDIATALALISLGTSQIVFAGRAVPKQFPEDYQLLWCPGFTHDEAEQYVMMASSEAPFATQLAIERSLGNPLYLRYYLQSSPGTTEPADSVDDYHASMWMKLTIRQKELISAVCLSEISLTFNQLSQVLTRYRGKKVSSIAAMGEAEEIEHVLSIGEKCVEIFHPSFREYVIREITRAGHTQEIHRHLSTIFTKRGNLTLRVLHLARAGLGDKVYLDLLSVANWAEVTGRTSLSRELIALALKIGRKKEDWFILGLGLHQAANLKQHTRSLSSALLSSGLSEKMFMRSKRDGVALIARSARGLFLLELDRGDEAEAILRDVADEYKHAGATSSEAMVRANLGFVLVRKGRMADCAEQCHLAIDLFERVGNSYGVAVALMNLQNYYIAMNDSARLISCIRKLRIIARELESPRLEIAAYNGLTIFYRRKGKHDKAEKACLKGIALSKMLGLWDVELSNIGNLGNVYRDQKLFAKARECYETVGRRGEEKRSLIHIAWGKELMATLIEREGNVAASVVMGEESAILLRGVGQVHRQAIVEGDQARRFHKLGDHAGAAGAAERAALAWIACGIFHEAQDYFVRAIEKWIEAGSNSNAVRVFSMGWEALAPKSPEDSLRLLIELSDVVGQLGPILEDSCLSSTLPSVLVSTTTRGIARYGISFFASVVRLSRSGDVSYDKFLRSLLSEFELRRTEASAIALAFAIEQAPAGLFIGESFGMLCQSLTDESSGLVYRCDSIIGERWMIFFPTDLAPAIELVVDYEVPGVRAASAMCALFLWAKRYWFLESMKSWGWRRLGLCLHAISAEELESNGVDLSDSFSIDSVSIIANSADQREESCVPATLIIRNCFLDSASEVEHPGNRCSLGLLWQVCREAIVYFTLGQAPNEEVRTLCLQFASGDLGFRLEDSGEDSSDEIEFGDDFS